MRKLLAALGVISIVAILGAQGSGTPNVLRVKTDSNNALMVVNSTQTPPYTTSVFNNTRLKTDADGNLMVAVDGGTEFEGIINVKSYGVTGDGRQVTDAVTTNTSTTITSATANFNSTRDVGKLVWGAKLIGGGVGSSLSVPLGTIVSVTNITTIVVSIAAVATNTGVALVWGTDDTDNLQTAFAAAYNNGVMGPKPTIYLPAGMYIVDELLADWRTSAVAPEMPAIIGSGSDTTTFIYKPDFDFTTLIAGRGMLVAMSDIAIGHFEGFSVTGASYAFGALLQVALRLQGTMTIKDIYLHHIQSASPVSGGINIATCGVDEAGQQCIIDKYIAQSIVGSGLYTSSSNIIIENLMMWEYEGAQIDNGTKATIIGGNFGDHFDSPTNTAFRISGGSRVKLVGTRIRHKLDILGASTDVICDSCTIGDINNTTNVDAVSIGANAQFRFNNSTLTSWGTGVWLINSGTAYDTGGNRYIAGTGSGGFTTAAAYGSSVPTTFALVPTCNAAAASQRNSVTDSNTIVWGATVAGGGADHVGAYCNGTNWTVAAK